MQKYFAMFLLSAVFALTAHAAEDLPKQAHPDNAACLYAADNLTYAIPGTTPAKLWRDDGHIRLPANVSGTDRGALAQSITAKGGGILFAQDAKPGTVTNVGLDYDANGQLNQIKLSHDGRLHKYSETLRYSHDAEGCRLERVVVQAPELGGGLGVSFDAKLCAKLRDKQLLDAKTAQTCSDFNSQVGAVVDEFSAGLPKGEAFTLFTSTPAGGIQLKKYAAHDYPAANAALARDCLASWRPLKGVAPNDDSGVERGDKAGIPTTAR